MFQFLLSVLPGDRYLASDSLPGTCPLAGASAFWHFAFSLLVSFRRSVAFSRRWR